MLIDPFKCCTFAFKDKDILQAKNKRTNGKYIYWSQADEAPHIL